MVNFTIAKSVKMSDIIRFLTGIFFGGRMSVDMEHLTR